MTAGYWKLCDGTRSVTWGGLTTNELLQSQQGPHLSRPSNISSNFYAYFVLHKRCVFREQIDSLFIRPASHTNTPDCPVSLLHRITSQNKPGIQRVQALADILHSALRCHSNETCAPTANPLNSAQLEGTSYHTPKLHPGPCGNAARDIHTHMTNIHFSSSTTP